MSDILDQFASDLDDIHFEEYGMAATYSPAESSSSFAVTVVPGNAEEDYLRSEGMRGMQTERREGNFTASAAAIRSGIEDLSATAREARRGDTLTITEATDPRFAGAWTVQRTTPQLADRVVLHCVKAAPYQEGGGSSG